MITEQRLVISSTLKDSVVGSSDDTLQIALCSFLGTILRDTRLAPRAGLLVVWERARGEAIGPRVREAAGAKAIFLKVISLHREVEKEG